MCLPPWSQKILRFTVFRLLENAFVKLPPSPPSLHDLFLSPHVKHPPINFPKKFVPQRKAFLKKRKKVPILFCLFIVFYFFCFPYYFCLSLSSYVFPFLKVSSLSATSYGLSGKTTQSMCL